MEPLYETNQNCLCCSRAYTTSKVRPSFKKPKRVDADFCGHYKPEVNPDYYVVKVCPYCGFASTENGMAAISEQQKQAYMARIGSRWTAGREYGGERSLEQALECYKLALLTAQAIGEKERIIAGILHHLGWLYRYDENGQQEARFLQYAMESYIEVFENEADSLNDAKLMFLIGELNRRLDKPNEAVRWFSRVVNDKRITDAGMIRASREQWTVIREEQEAKAAAELAALTALAGEAGGAPKQGRNWLSSRNG
ncbi:DUF2225 domain-containing protein [Paenibacillus sp. GCM10023252]|uniref:DUF2225 domain-containing protein n=1 Tax=Paenibacillus sp. GCM10023252 TaxID=3252649 RepID=UPI003618B53C